MKQQITTGTRAFFGTEINGSRLTAVRDRFNALIDKFGPDGKLDMEDDGIYFYVETTREETDAEYATRLERESVAKSRQEERERATLAALTAKYA